MAKIAAAKRKSLEFSLETDALIWYNSRNAVVTL